jgi:hypothetical protein
MTDTHNDPLWERLKKLETLAERAQRAAAVIGSELLKIGDWPDGLLAETNELGILAATVADGLRAWADVIQVDPNEPKLPLTSSLN